VIVVAEGLTMYLDEKDATALFRRITEQFPSGQIAFDAYSRTMIRMISRLMTVGGAKVDLRWGLDDPHDLERQVPGLQLAEDVEFLTMPDLVSRLSKNSFSWAMNRMVGRLPFYRNLIHHLRYAFSGKSTA